MYDGMYDAEGRYEYLPCPECGSLETVTYHYEEGFSELECQACGYRSDREELSELGRYRGELREKEGERPPIPIKPLEA
jgi:uncharacterized metal-binding protein (TIGR02443 family)